MSTREIKHFASVVIIYSKEHNKLVLSEYDDQYPGCTSFRGSANIIGGNRDFKSDISSLDTLVREIREEFVPNEKKDPNIKYRKRLEERYLGSVPWADDEHIKLIRNLIIKNLTPYQDFYVVAEKISNELQPYTALINTFELEIEDEILSLIENNIERDKVITTEGLVRVFSIEELENSPRKELTTAYAAGHILNYKFGSNIPVYEKIKIEALGLPKRSYEEYIDDFSFRE